MSFENFEFSKQFFRKNYPSLGEMKKIQKLEHDDINSINYVLSTNKGRFVLRNFIDYSNPKKIEKMCEVLDFCKSNSIKVPEPVKNNKEMYVCSKFNVYLTKFYEGKFFSGTISELLDLSKNLALLHKTLRNVPFSYNYKTKHQFYKTLNIENLTEIKNIIKKKRPQDFDKKVTKDIDFLISFLKKYQNSFNEILKENVNRQLIHYDVHPNNVIFTNNKVAVILDFNSMRKGNVVEDVSFTGFRFSINKKYDIENIKKRMRVFVLNYLKYNKLYKKELVYFDTFLRHKIFGKVSFILKHRYFNNSNFWISDYDKNVSFLKLLYKHKMI